MKQIKQLLTLVAMWTLPMFVMAQSYGGSSNLYVQSNSVEGLRRGDNIITVTVGNVNFDMVKVTAGDFIMGVDSESDDFHEIDEVPPHHVTLTNDYYIGKFEVTQELYEAVMGTNPSKPKIPNHPVENVHWNNAQIFCAKLSQMTGYYFRLPTEAEWEYAARGGKKSTEAKYSGSSNIDSVAWYSNGSREIIWNNYGCVSKSHPVGQLQPNELGIYDMSGNVWEWCYDWKGPYMSEDQTNPTGRPDGNRRVLRGGSWYNDDDCCRVSNRTSNTPEFYRCDVGFRVVLCPGPSKVKSRESHVQEYTETALGVNMRMAYVEGGSFIMGCTADQCNECNTDELPNRLTTVSSFYMGVFEVTQSQWEKVMGTSIQYQRNKSNAWELNGVGPDYPMYYVSWEEAKEFCARLSKLAGKNYSLPTEAEWEYAARGGKNGDGTKYSGSWLVDDVAWYDGNSGGMAHPVGQLQPNALGIYDMSGNVFEWCEDWYDEFSSDDNDNPKGSAEGTMRVLRGSGWPGHAGNGRVASRGGNYPGARGSDSSNGFRVVMR